MRFSGPQIEVSGEGNGSPAGRVKFRAAPTRVAAARAAQSSEPTCEQSRNALSSPDARLPKKRAGGRLSRRPERGAAPGRCAWRRRAGRPLLIIAGAGTGKTKTLGAPRGASGAQRRRSAAHPAADLLPPRRRGDVRRAGRTRPKRSAGERRCLAEGLTWAGTFHAIGARLLREQRRRSGSTRLHDPRPRRRRRPDGPGAPRARLVEDGEALSAQGHLPRDLLPRVNTRAPSATCCEAPFPGARVGGGAEAAVPRLCRGEAGEQRPRLRRPAALLGADAGRRRRSPPSSAPASTTSWSTSTRTPTGCRRRS